MAAPPVTTVACEACGALNGVRFERCVRCQRPLEGAKPPAPGAKPRRRPPAAPRAPEEKVLGRFAAESLPAARAIVVINVLVFALHLLLAFAEEPGLGTLLGGGPPALAFQFGALLPANPGLVIHEPWRLLSACYVHFGALHILFNMMSLIYLARLAEPAVGSVRFFIAYTITGIAGFAVSAIWYTALSVSGAPSASITAGASGAVFGIMGLILGFLWRRRDPRWKRWLTQAVMFSIAFGFMMKATNNSAHLGGLAAGVVFGALFAPKAPKPSRGWQRFVAAVLGAVTVLSLVGAQLSPLTALTKQSRNEPSFERVEPKHRDVPRRKRRTIRRGQADEPTP